MKTRPSPPEQNNVRTFYEGSTFLSKITGRYSIAWKNNDGEKKIRVHARLTDMEGYRPSWKSALRMPEVIKTYLESRKQPILKDPVPYLVWDAIDFLEEEVKPGMKVLEVGSGNSTCWFLGKGCEVTSFEHSGEWAEAVMKFNRERLGEESVARLDYHVEEGDDAIKGIAELPDNTYDLVLIDSMNEHTYRPAALAAARSKVRSGGLMVLDNADHPNNWPALDMMADLERIRFTGYCPMGCLVGQTSMWRMP